VQGQVRHQSVTSNYIHAALLIEARKWGLTFDTSRLADFGWNHSPSALKLEEFMVSEANSAAKIQQ
jgi:hypothetical protein